MRSALACAVSLAAAPLAASRAGALVDEVSLVQRFLSRGVTPEGAPQYELVCDEMHGCRYNVQQASSTPAPYQLVCDEAAGCHYTGVTAPPSVAPPTLFKAPDEQTVKKMMVALAGAAKPKKPVASPMLPMSMMGATPLAALAALPRSHKAPLKIVGVPPQPGKAQPALPKFQMPSPVQLARWIKEYRGLDSAETLRLNMTGVKYLLEMVSPKSTPKPPAAEAAKLFAVGAAKTEARQPEEAVAHFVPDNKMCCVQGPAGYLREKLAKLKASPIGGGYISTTVASGTCVSAGYEEGPKPESCFPKATLHTSKLHPLDPLSEPTLMYNYALKHGADAVGKGMAELCKA